MDEKLEILKQNVRNKESLYIEFAEKYIKYKKEYNTDKFIFFMQVGSFYENYSWEIKKDNFHLFDKESRKTCSILNMFRSYKSSAKEHSYENPRMYGLPTISSERHMERLLDEGWTIVIIKQRDGEGKTKIRDVVERYTPGTNLNNRYNDNYIMNIILDEYKGKKFCGLSLVNINADDNYFYECSDTYVNDNIVINNIVKIILQFNPIEYVIYNLTQINDELLLNTLNIQNKNVNIKYHISSDYRNIEYHKFFFDKIYGNESLLSSIEKINLSNTPEGRLSYLLLLKYVYDQNKVLLNNVEYPKFLSFDDTLNLDFNTAEQLNIIGNTEKDKYSIISLFDYTSTNMGRRTLKRNIMSPSANKEQIQTIYDIIEEMMKNYNDYEIELEELPDITKKHKKISFGTITPKELYDLNHSYKSIKKIINLTKNNKKLSEYLKNNYYIKEEDIDKYLDDYKKIFNEKVEYCRDIQEITTSIFVRDYNKEIDKLSDELLHINKYRDKVRNIINEYIKEKLKINKYSLKDEKNLFGITKAKLKLIKKCMDENGYLIYKDEKFYHKRMNNKDYLSTEKLDENNIKENRKIQKLRELTEKKYTEYLKELSKKQVFFKKLDKNISYIDFIKSGAKCAVINYYTKPIIDHEEEESYFDMEEFQHPIIKKINQDIPFISNSLKLNSKTNGMILSGVNGTGKSSLMKNIGINIIIAQAGYYVPCKKMKYVPFTKILTRIKGNDNIYTNSSSYVVEIAELKNIIQKADNKSLVLIDEACRGTELSSAHALTISITDFISKNSKSKFILTTHLHSIFKNDIIKKLRESKKLMVKHLSIGIEEDGTISYLRKLVDGESDSKYGLEIAKSLGIDKSIISNAFKIRNDFNHKPRKIVVKKKSKYNKNVFIDSCKLCNSTEQLETHHIIEQKEANGEGYIIEKNIHKNEKHNLIILCKKCHSKITFGKIRITGKRLTTNGIKYDVKILK